VIREALYEGEGSKRQPNHKLIELLRTMSLLASPVPEKVLLRCREQATVDCQAESTVECREGATLELLEEARTLRLAFHIQKTRLHESLWSLHPSVRAHFATLTTSDPQEHVIENDALTPLLMPSVGRHVPPVEPSGERDIAAAKGLLKRLCDEADQDLAVTPTDEASAPPTVSPTKLWDAQLLVRTLVAALRARMEPATAARWWTLDEYLKIVCRVGNLTKAIAHLSPGGKEGNLWLAGNRLYPEVFESPSGTLLAEEQLWLYSAIGMTYYKEGNIFDALLLLQEALEIAVVIGGETGSGANVTVALCNLGAAYRQYGSLSRAERCLRQALTAAERLEDADHVGSVHLELAIVEQLRGNLSGSRIHLRKAGKLIDRENLRGRSRLAYYRAECALACGDTRGAEDALRDSRAFAELGAYPDQLARCRIGAGHILISKGRPKDALAEYQWAARDMRDKGIYSLVADALCGSAWVLNDQGDPESARRHAIEALALASEGLLGPRIAGALVILGVACVGCDMRDLGVAYLERAKQLANRQGYATKKTEAEAELRRLGAS
jgi:tetratricopeptide (TPR) repeat protein